MAPNQSSFRNELSTLLQSDLSPPNLPDNIRKVENNQQTESNNLMNTDTDTEFLSIPEMDAIVEVQMNLDPSKLPAAIDALNADQLVALLRAVPGFHNPAAGHHWPGQSPAGRKAMTTEQKTGKCCNFAGLP
jgi:hypothetical protein